MEDPELHQAHAPVGLPPPDAAVVRRHRDRREEPDLPLSEARVLHHRQGRSREVRQGHGQPTRPARPRGNPEGPQGLRRVTDRGLPPWAPPSTLPPLYAGWI